MSSISDLPGEYFFRKLKRKIYSLCFFTRGIESVGLRDQINLHLMKTLFLGDSYYKNKFISFINTNDEISLFLDKNSLDKFVQGISTHVSELLNTDGKIFRAFEVYSSKNDLFSPGVTAFISGRLALKGIPIIYTNSFNSSFILVPDEQYTGALAVLKSIANPSEDDVQEDE